MTAGLVHDKQLIVHVVNIDTVKNWSRFDRKKCVTDGRAFIFFHCKILRSIRLIRPQQDLSSISISEAAAVYNSVVYDR